MSTLDEYNHHFYIENNQLLWKNPTTPWIKQGDVAGSLWKDDRHYTGYWICTLKGKKLKNHIIMYQIYNNIDEIPKGLVIDHINRNSEDNSKDNLRMVTQKENIWNSRIQKNNTSGCKGVSYYSKNKKWGVRVCVEGVREFLGLFNSFDDAVIVYKEATNKHRNEIKEAGTAKLVIS